MLAVGALVLLWLPVEDLSVRPALVLAAALSGLGAWRVLASSPTALGRPRVRLALGGLLAGLAVAPLALGLMIFKNGLHGHSQPDFTLAQAAALLRTAPAWGAGGLLAGLGFGLLHKRKQEVG
jgi:hypothetical protein